MPDPLGPTSPKVSPFATSSEMSCKISTIPAFPFKESDTLESERTGADMAKTFVRRVAFGYGAVRGLRNLITGMLFTVSAAQAETVIVAALGDSLTAGYGLTTSAGFVPQLQSWLTAQDIDAELRNAGVSGDTTAGGLSRTDWTLTPDVDAMIVTLGGNDYLRGLDPAISRANLRGILEKAAVSDVDVLLVGLTAGNNYGADYKAQFEAMYQDLATEFDVLFFENFFQGLSEAAGTRENVQAFMQSDNIHPNKEGVSAIVAAIAPSVVTLVQNAKN